MDVVEPPMELSSTMIQAMQVLEPAPGILAFYDGRNSGQRYSETENWVDDGALALGIASYALVAGEDALVYDTHTSLDHARFVRRVLEEAGVKRMTVVLSHWHLDHVAGNDVFADCEIISNAKTARHLAEHRRAIEAGVHEGPPAIQPLRMPTRTFTGSLALEVGPFHIELFEADIHSDDATLLWLKDQRLLFAGDTIEDTVTYVVEPKGFDRHLSDLDRLYALSPERILPNHGAPSIIASGGYGKGSIRAMQQYIRMLKRSVLEPEVRAMPLKEMIAGPLSAGWVTYFEAYEAVHARNLVTVAGALTAP